MAKMTKEAAIELLKNRKVYVNGKSAEIQKRLFELGWEWSDAPYKDVSYIKHPFLYIYDSMKITYNHDMQYFMNHKHIEISAEEILAIEIASECPFKPFDKVLVRTGDSDVWRADIFSHYIPAIESLPPTCCCIGNLWRQCIPYENNEHLLGTTNNPED